MPIISSLGWGSGYEIVRVLTNRNPKNPNPASILLGAGLQHLAVTTSATGIVPDSGALRSAWLLVVSVRIKMSPVY